MTTMTRTDWSNVTMAEYDALSIIRRSDAVEFLNAYWDMLAELDPFHDGPPNRLRADAVAWLEGLRETYHTTTDERELIRVAREFVRSMGTMLTVNVARELKRGWLA